MLELRLISSPSFHIPYHFGILCLLLLIHVTLYTISVVWHTVHTYYVVFMPMRNLWAVKPLKVSSSVTFNVNTNLLLLLLLFVSIELTLYIYIYTCISVRPMFVLCACVSPLMGASHYYIAHIFAI